MKELNKKETVEESLQKTRPPKGEKETRDRIGIEKLAKDREDLPPFPKAKKGVDTSTGSLTEEEETDFEAIDIEEFCRDLANIPFEIAHIIKPSIKPLEPKEKKLIGKPLSRVIVKHNLDKMCKDEFVLIALLGVVILKRVRQAREPEEVEAK